VINTNTPLFTRDLSRIQSTTSAKRGKYRANKPEKETSCVLQSAESHGNLGLPSNQAHAQDAVSKTREEEAEVL